MRAVWMILLAIGLAAPVAAQTFRAENRVTVTPVAGGFEVRNGGGFGARGMWCAAADYARDVSGASGQQLVYVAQGRKPGLGQRDPVRFTLDGSGLTPRGVFIVSNSLRSVGSALTVDHAYSFCADAKVINR